MNYILFELLQNKWCILFIILLVILFRKSKVKMLIPIALTLFCLYVNYYGVSHHDFNLIKYQSVSIDENLSKKEVKLLNRYLNNTKKVFNSHNYPDEDYIITIKLKNENKEDEYITIYTHDGMIFKGYFLDVSSDYMIGRAFDYYIVTPELFKFLELDKK